MLRTILSSLVQTMIVAALMMTATNVQAQSCTPDSSLTGLGVEPDTLPPACVGVPYSFSATIIIPADTVAMGFNAEICYNRLDSLNNVPAGMQVTCDPTLSTPCQYPGGSIRCALVSGTPTMADTGWNEVVIFTTGRGCPTSFGGCPNGSFCQTMEATDTVLIRIDAPATAQASNDTTICQGQSTQLTASGGNSYQWSPSASLNNASIANPVATPTMTTDYMVTVTDGACSDVDTVTVTVDPPIIAETSNDTTICQGGSAQLSASGGQSYQWSPSANLSNASIANPVASPSVTTDYVVTVTDGPCTDTDTVTVFISDVTADAGMNSSVSAGNSATIGGSPAATGGTTPYTYSWSPSGSLSNASNPNPTANPSSTTTYSLTVTDAKGCTNTDNVTVTVTTGPLVADAGQKDTICNGQSEMIGGNPTASGGNSPYTYTWSPAASLSDPSIPNPMASPSSTTMYTVTVTDNTSDTDVDTVMVMVNDTPSLTVNNNPSICQGSSASLGVSVNGGMPPYNYSWSPSSTLSDPNVASPTASPLSTTTYNVTVTDNNGCQGTASVTVTVNPVPNADAGRDKTICRGSSTTLNASGGGTYQWMPAASLDDPASQSPNASPDSTTTYTVTVTSSAGCDSTDDVTVNVNPLPSVSLGPDTSSCDSLLLEADGSFSAYQWSNGASSQSIWVTSSGAYSLTVTDNNGCEASDTVNVMIYNSPNVNLGNDTMVCDSFTIMASPGYASYNWSTGDSSSSIKVKQSATYSLTATTDNGCKGTGSIDVTIDTCVGIEDRSAFKQSLSIRPNPNRGVFTIFFSAESNVEGQLKLFNLQGQILREKDVSINGGQKKLQMDLQEQPSGLYYLQFRTEKGVLNRKVIVR